MSRKPRTYTLTVIVEPKEGAWHAYCPTLLDYGAATWGGTREEALRHIGAMVAMVVERLIKADVPVPSGHVARHAPPSGERAVVTVRASAN